MSFLIFTVRHGSLERYTLTFEHATYTDSVANRKLPILYFPYSNLYVRCQNMLEFRLDLIGKRGNNSCGTNIINKVPLGNLKLLFTAKLYGIMSRRLIVGNYYDIIAIVPVV